MDFITKTKQNIKRIAAISAITLMGATAACGAVAATDLSEYPTSFVEEGVWNAQIVMGLDAKPADIIGATNLAVSIANEAGITTTAPTVEGGAKLETADNKLNFYEEISGPRATLTDSQLPVLLADGQYTNDRGVTFDYTQQIEISDNPVLDYNEYDDVSDSPNLYIYQESDVELLRYRMIFTNAAESEVDGELLDFKDTAITILGKEYEITNVDTTDTGVKFHLMGGAARASMFEGDEATYTINDVDYEVKVTYVGETAAKLVINGEATKKLEEGQTDEVAGITIGIKEILENEAGEVQAGRDMVEFYLGADKITLEDDDVTDPAERDEIRVSENTIDGVYVDIKMTEVSGDVDGDFDDDDVWELNTITIQYSPEDEVYIYKDNPYVDPALGEWKLDLADTVIENEETIEVNTDSSNRIKVTLPLTAGEVDIPAFYTDGAWHLGKNDDKPFFNDENENIYVDGDEYFVVSDEDNKESYLMQVDKLDEDDNQIEFRDAMTKDEYMVTYDDNTGIGSFTIGSLTIEVDYNETLDELYVDMNDDGSYDDAEVPFYTENGATVVMHLEENLADQDEYRGVTLTGNGTFWAEGVRFEVTDWDGNDGTVTREAGISVIEEEQDDGDHEGAIYVTLGVTNDDRSDVKNIYYTDDGETDDQDFALNAILDSDKYVDYTEYGTKCTLDTTSDQSSAEIVYTDAEAYAEVWFSPAGATVTVTSGGYVMPTGVVAVSDADADVSKPLILVGGPCINKLTAQAMGLEYPACGTSSTMEENTAIIRLVEDAFTEGNVAMIVAGWEAEDTTAALNILRGGEGLTGTEIEIVNGVIPEEVEEVEETE